MDAEEKFLDAIYKRKKKDLHVKFFEDDGELQFIMTPLFTHFSGKKRIAPYRNTHCLKPECVYDEQELVKRFKQSGLSTFSTFICHTCRKQIQLIKFCFDEALESILQDVWEHYNKETKLICENVKIFRNGTWEPILPPYIKTLEENLRREFEGEGKHERKIPGYDEGEDELEKEDNRLNRKSAVKKMVIYKNLQKLSDFEQSEYLHLNAQYINDSDPMGNLKSLMFKRYGSSILNSDFITIQNESYFPKHIMGFFFKYLEDWANRIIMNELDANHHILNKRNPSLNKARFIGFFVVKVISYDQFYHLAKYEIWSDNLTSIKQRLNKDQFATQIDKIYIVMHYDERWILTVSDPRSKKIKIVDFLDKEMSRIKVDEVDDISRFIIEKEVYPVKVNIQEDSPEIKTINFYSDCGYYISAYLYKSIITDRVLGEMPYFNVKYGEKNRMRDLLSWLFLKYAYSDDADQQVQVKDMEVVRDSFSEEESKRNQEKAKELDDYEDDMIERWNLDRVDNSLINSNSLQRQQSPNKSNFFQSNKSKSKSGQHSFDFLLNNLDTKDSQIKHKPSFQSESSIHSNMQSINKGQSQNQSNNQYPSQKDSLLLKTNSNIMMRQGSGLDLSRQQSHQSTKSQAQLKVSKNNSSLPLLNKDTSQQKIPYFVSTKGQLNNLLQDWHRNLMEDARAIQKQKEDEELKQMLEKEEKFIDNLKQHGSQQAINKYNQQLDKEDIERLSELQKRQYIEARINYHRDQLDAYYKHGVDQKMLDQLSIEDLSTLLIRFQQLRLIENPELIGSDQKYSMLNGIQGLSSDPFTQNIGIDYGQLDPQEMMELAQWNNMLQSSIAQTAMQNQIHEKKKKKEKSNKRGKSKKKNN